MLEKLFISKVRIKVLKEFLASKSTQPPVELHVRALVRKLDEEINAIRRELKNLEEAEILISQEIGNRIVYKLNERNPFLSDLRQMLFKDSPIAQSLIYCLKNFPNIHYAILTHYFLNESYTTPNDLDLLLIGEAEVNSLNNVIGQIERESGRQLRVSILSLEDFEFRKKKRDLFITNIIYNEHVIILGKEKDLSLN
jgi:DNA-binding transcriptional ArsR family regulator